MSVTINNSPVHSEAMISYPYGVSDSGYTCGYHTGVDIVPHGSTENLPMLYSCVSGTVVNIINSTSGALGVQVQILDDNGFYWRYCHMTLNSIQVSLNQRVNTSTVIGRMGATGNVTGRHLHLECSTTMAWQCDTFVNPCTKLGIPNEDDLVILYDGSVPPTPPIPPTPTTNNAIKKWMFSKFKKIIIKY